MNSPFSICKNVEQYNNQYYFADNRNRPDRRAPDFTDLFLDLVPDLNITDDEYTFLEHLGAHIDNEDYTHEQKVALSHEMLHGAYIQIEDGGKSYDIWVKVIKEKTSRISSHESSDQQFAIRGPLFSECLFSKKKIVVDGNEREVSWFQLERYPFSPLYFVPHMMCWAVYRATGKNQGPCGVSRHTENQTPIVLRISCRA